jgi:hypothetical protein
VNAITPRASATFIGWTSIHKGGVIMSTVFRSCLRVLCASGAIALLSAVPAHAQLATNMTFRTGFPFVVGNEVLPAGSYTISRIDEEPFVILIRGTRSALLETNFAGRAPAQGAKQDEVVFQKRGDQYVMQEIWDADSSTGVVSTMAYKLGREAKNMTGPETLAVPASVNVSSDAGVR